MSEQVDFGASGEKRHIRRIDIAETIDPAIVEMSERIAEDDRRHAIADAKPGVVAA